MEKFTYNLQGQDIIEAHESGGNIFTFPSFDLQRFDGDSSVKSWETFTNTYCDSDTSGGTTTYTIKSDYTGKTISFGSCLAVPSSTIVLNLNGATIQGACGVASSGDNGFDKSANYVFSVGNNANFEITGTGSIINYASRTETYDSSTNPPQSTEANKSSSTVRSSGIIYVDGTGNFTLSSSGVTLGSAGTASVSIPGANSATYTFSNTAYYGVMINGSGKVTINEGTVIGQYAVGTTRNDVANNATIEINGGTITGYQYGVYSSKGTTYINGGTINTATISGLSNGTANAAVLHYSPNGVYIPHTGTVYITGSKADVNISGNTGVEIRGGTLDVDASGTATHKISITGTFTPSVNSVQPFGSATAGAGIGFADHYEGKPTLALNVGGSNTTITGHSALYVVNPGGTGGVAKDKTVNITGGTFISTKETSTTNPASAITYTASDVKLSVSGGVFDGNIITSNTDLTSATILTGIFALYKGTDSLVTDKSGTFYYDDTNGNGATIGVASGANSTISGLDNKETVAASLSAGDPKWKFIGYSTAANVSLQSDYKTATISGTAAASINSAATVIGQSTGTVAGLASNAAATVSNGVVTGIGSLAGSGYWALGTATTGAVSDRTWTFSATDATLSNTTASASEANKVDVKSGEITLSGGTNKANWTLGGNNSYGATFSTTGYTKATLTAASDGNVYAYANSDVEVTAAESGGVAEVAKSAGVTVSGGLITAVDSLAAGGGWSLQSAKVASVGSQVWTFSEEGASLTAGSKAGGATTAKLVSGASMTLGGVANWSVNGEGASGAVATFDSSAYNKATLTATSGDVIAQTDSDATVVGSTAGSTVAGLAAGAKVTVEGSTLKGIDALAASGYWNFGSNSGAATIGGQNWSIGSTGGATLSNTGTSSGLANKVSLGASNAAILSGSAGSVAIPSVTLTADTGGGYSEFVSTTQANLGGKMKARAEVVATVTGANSKGGGTVAGLAAENDVIAADGVISTVTALASGGTWVLGSAKDVTLGSQKWSFANSAGATLTNGGTDVGSATKVDFVGKTATLSGLTALGGEDTPFIANGVQWDSVGGFGGSAIAFDAAGNIGVAASTTSTVTVTGAYGANVSIGATVASDNTSTLLANGANVLVTDSDDKYVVTLGETEKGISGITGLGSDGQVVVTGGETTFGVGTGTVVTGAVVRGGAEDNEKAINVAFTGNKELQIYGVSTGDNYGGTDLTDGTVVYNLTAVKDDATNVSVGADSVNLSIMNAKNVANTGVSVSASGNSNITSISGVEVGDAITSSDSEMTLVFTTGTVLSAATDESAAIITANDIKVSLTSKSQASTNTIVVNVASTNDGVADTNDKATITGLASDATVSAGAGTYTWKGKSGTGVITEASGVLYLEGNNIIAMDQSAVAAAEKQKEQEEALSTLGSGTEAADAYKAFMGGIAKATSNASTNTTVVGFTDGATVSGSVTTDASVASGVNLYSESDTTVGKASKVTLQVVGMSTALNISAAERPGSTVLSEAVIDLTESNVDTMVIGASSAAVTTKNTILGANVQSTIMVGSNASGQNYVQAGAAGAYMIHTGDTKTSLVGGAASDTINTGNKGDYVFGGTGADYFYDGAVQIQDYNYSEGDIIVAQKLGTAGIQLSQIALAKNRININAGGQVTLGSAADSEVYAAAIAGNDGSTLANVLWTGASGTTLTASDYTNKGAIINANADTIATAVDYIVGTSAADTIVVGAGDTILAGAGNDSIIVANNPKSAGAMIQLAAGKNTVEGWKYGFNYESGGSNILYAKASNLDFKSGNGYAVVYSGNNSLTFADSGNSGAYEIVTRSGSTYTNMTFVANGGSASVTSSDSLSGYYVGEGKNSSLTFTSGVDTDLGVLRMDSSTLTGITYLDVSNSGNATVMGTDEAETLKVVGENRKYASLGAGNDYIISGGNTSSRYDKAGNTFYFGTSDGRDTITGFSYWLGSSVDSDQDYADIIRVSSSPTAVKRTSNGVEVSLSSSARVVIDDSNASSDAANDMILLKVKNAAAKAIKVGLASGDNNFAYNDSVSAYYGNTARGQDTLTVGDDAAVTKINLNSTSTYQGIKDVDASAAITSSRLTIYGKSGTNNVITGGTTQTRMWGRSGHNTLIGGTGADQFVAYGSGAYNTFKNYDESQGDLVWLYKSSLSNLSSRGIDTDNKTISLTFKNGSTVTVDDIASGTTNVKVRIGSSYYNANLETGKWSKTTA